MKLVDDIQHFWKWWSVRFGLIASAFAGTVAAYALLPADMLPEIPAWAKQVLAAGTLGFTFLSVLSRGVDQPKLKQ